MASKRGSIGALTLRRQRANTSSPAASTPSSMSARV
jgi:hypothetical protein